MTIGHILIVAGVAAWLATGAYGASQAHLNGRSRDISWPKRMPLLARIPIILLGPIGFINL